MNTHSLQSSSPEVLITTVWPTIGATVAGRLVGALSGMRLGIGFFTLGKIMALATIPLSLAVFCWQLMPIVCRRYALTNRRIVIRKGLTATEGPSIGLDEFDTIEIRILPGQQWLHCGEIMFRRGAADVFHLAGVSRPDVFREICLKARTALVSMEPLRGQPDVAPAAK